MASGSARRAVLSGSGSSIWGTSERRDLLRRFDSDATPAFGARSGCLSEMLLAAARDDGNDARGSELGDFLDGPLHAIEFEDGEQESDGERGIGFDFGDEVEADRVAGDAGDDAMPDVAAGDDIEFHAGFGAEDADEVGGLIAGERGGRFIPGVGDPAAAGHGERVQGTGCRVQGTGYRRQR